MTVGENSATPDGAVHAYCILGKARPLFIVAPFTFIVSGQINIGQIFLFYNVF